MYGVPDHLPAGLFVGAEFNQVCLGRFQLQLHASDVGSISIDGRWELWNADGALIDSVQEHPDRRAYRVHEIIDVPITEAVIDAPRSFSLVFRTGHRLTIYDDTPQYESFSVHLKGQPSIYV